MVASKQHDAGEAIFDEQAIIDVSHTTGAKSLRKGLPPLDLATIKDFLRYIASVSDGLIEIKGLVTADSLNTFGEWFFAGFARVTGNRIEAEDRHSVYDATLATVETVQYFLRVRFGRIDAAVGATDRVVLVILLFGTAFSVVEETTIFSSSA